MNINNPTTFSTPDLTLSTANSSGTAGALRADDTILVYDTTVPTTIASGASAATGSASVSSRRDHQHGAFTVTAAATQAEEEAASSTTVYTTPGRQKYHPGTAKGWAYVTVSGGSPTLAANYNVSGIVDSDVGRFDITWDVDFSSVNYSVAGMSGSTTFIGFRDVNVVGTTYVITNDADGSAKDPANWSVVAFGDQ